MVTKSKPKPRVHKVLHVRCDQALVDRIAFAASRAAVTESDWIRHAVFKIPLPPARRHRIDLEVQMVVEAHGSAWAKWNWAAIHEPRLTTDQYGLLRSIADTIRECKRCFKDPVSRSPTQPSPSAGLAVWGPLTQTIGLDLGSYERDVLRRSATINDRSVSEHVRHLISDAGLPGCVEAVLTVEDFRGWQSVLPAWERLYSGMSIARDCWTTLARIELSLLTQAKRLFDAFDHAKVKS